MQQLEALRPAALEIVAAARAHDLIGYLEADRRFHLELLGLSGNDRLVETVGDLRKRSRLYGLTRLDERNQLLPSAEEHEELLDVMLTGRRRGGRGLYGPPPRPCPVAVGAEPRRTGVPHPQRPLGVRQG